MSEPLLVTIPHTLGKDEARRRLSGGFSGLASKVPALKLEDETWTGDRMDFRARALGQVVTGSVDVSEDQVRIALMLPWLLQRIAESIRPILNAGGRALLENKKPA